MTKRGRIILLHFVGQMPLGGIAWQAMHYLLGLERLGYETWYIEDGGANPYDPRANSVVMECDYNVAYIERMMSAFGLGDRWAYWDAINDVYHGLSRERVHALYRESDALINLCGATRLRDEHMACPVRIMIDTDPIYEQIKYAKADAAAREYLGAHTHFFTYGENIGTPDCHIPLCGIDWRPTRPPVVPALWPVEPGEPTSFTTIATWENKGKNIEFEGASYVWSKHVNFLRFLDVPKHADAAFTIAMRPPEAAIAAELGGKGWQLTDPLPISADMMSYAEFVRGSRGEFTVAKDIYVRPNSGWFSDRSVCYLASGRPVITMESGFSKFIPTGKGLFAFSTMDEIVEAAAAIGRDFSTHSRAARAIAEEFFASDRVVGRLLSEVGF